MLTSLRQRDGGTGWPNWWKIVSYSDVERPSHSLRVLCWETWERQWTMEHKIYPPAEYMLTQQLWWEQCPKPQEDVHHNIVYSPNTESKNSDYCLKPVQPAHEHDMTSPPPTPSRMGWYRGLFSQWIWLGEQEEQGKVPTSNNLPGDSNRTNHILHDKALVKINSKGFTEA